MSIGERVVMLNTTLANIPIFYFSFYKTPKVIIHDIVKLQQTFLQSGGERKKKVNWVGWANICNPKQQGCLGVKDYEKLNLTFHSRWKWRILTKTDSIRVKLFPLGTMICIDI